MIFKLLGPLALLAALVIADQIRINRPGHKFRLTVDVETPAGVKSGSSVLAVTPVVDGDAMPRGGQGDGGGTSDATRGPGDECSAADGVRHDSVLPDR